MLYYQHKAQKIKKELEADKKGVKTMKEKNAVLFYVDMTFRDERITDIAEKDSIIIQNSMEIGKNKVIKTGLRLSSLLMVSGAIVNSISGGDPMLSATSILIANEAKETVKRLSNKNKFLFDMAKTSVSDLAPL